MKPFAKDYANLPLIVHSHSHTHTDIHTLAQKHWRAFIYIYIQLAEDLRIIIYAPQAPHFTERDSRELERTRERERKREKDTSFKTPQKLPAVMTVR